MQLISVQEMKKLEKNANDGGFTYSQMMTVAGRGIAEYLDSRYKNKGFNSIIGLIGKGNNGGDALIALTLLHMLGWSTVALIVSERDQKDALILDYAAAGGTIVQNDEILKNNWAPSGQGVVLDGVYGTGFHPPLPETTVDILKITRATLPGFDWVAVDCPSGIDCETGVVSPGTQPANLTLFLEGVKHGALSETAYPYCGEFKVIELGLSSYAADPSKVQDLVLDEEFCLENLPSRPLFSHKGTFGKSLVIGGSVNYPGAPVLAGRAAYAVGVGLVQVAIPESIAQVAPAGNPELTWLILEDGGGIISEQAADTISNSCTSVQSLVIGPGMGRESTTAKFFSRLFFEREENHQPRTGFLGIEDRESRRSCAEPLPPVVIDADGLFHLSKVNNWQSKVNARLILTPHPGEIAMLTGLSMAEIQADRIELSREYARKWNQVVVLKGALTVIADPNGKVAIVPIATSSLAKAGTGDVLAGMIGGLVAQGMDPWHAAAVGAYLHAQAGIQAERSLGCSESVLSTDVIRAIPQVYKRLKTNSLR